MEGKRRIEIVFESLEIDYGNQAESAEIKIRLIERELLTDSDCEDLNCMIVELFDQGSIYWEDSMAELDLMIQFQTYVDDRLVGSVSVPLRDLFIFEGGDFKQWIGLNKSPQDDIFQGDVGIDDQEFPRVLLNFQFHEVEEETVGISQSQDPSLATSTYAEEELVVRSVQDEDFERKDQSSFGELGLARESVTIGESIGYESENGVKLDFKSNQTEPAVVPLWKMKGCFLKSEQKTDSKKNSAKHKLSQSKDFDSGSKSSHRGSQNSAKKGSKWQSSHHKSVCGESFSPASKFEAVDYQVLSQPNAPPQLEIKKSASKYDFLEEKLASALIEIEKLKLLIKEKDTIASAEQTRLKKELEDSREENRTLLSQVNKGNKQSAQLHSQFASDRQELTDKILRLSTANKSLETENDRLSKLLEITEEQLNEVKTQSCKSHNTTVIGLTAEKFNAELVLAPATISKDSDNDDEVTKRVKAYFSKKHPNLPVKRSAKSRTRLLRPV